MKLVTAEQMQEFDRNAIETLGIPGVVLMENAGRAAAEEIDADAREIFPGPVLVLAGAGNNGGDGYVIARILADRGWQVRTLVLAAEERIRGDARLMLDILRNLDSELCFVSDPEQLKREFEGGTQVLLVDALLGTGLENEIRGLYRSAIDLINRDPAQVVAVDIPSGVNGSDGRVMGIAVRADLTLSFDSAKIGHASRPGADYVGELRVLDIGIPLARRADTGPLVEMIDPALAASLLPQRLSTGHKGSFGHLGVVAGSRGMTGAAALCANAGLRSGAGLTTLACPGSLHDILEGKLTEVMTRPLGESDHLCPASVAEVTELAARWQALVIGPGLGRHPQTVAALRNLVESASGPLVVDADGINALAADGGLAPRNSAAPPLVLTPHPGEFSRLCGNSIAEIEADRFRIARSFALEHQVVLLLKGARTLIADPCGRVRINSSGNAGLASGGSGDVLSGLIGGLIVQGLDPFDAASLAVWLHGAAADLLAEHMGSAGIMAGDLLEAIPVARHQLEGV